MNQTKNIILRLFARYPSLATANENQIAAMTAAYLETLRKFSSQQVSAACDAFASKGSAFPPSADELYADCEKRQKAEQDRRQWEESGARRLDFNRSRLPKPETRGYTLAQLADWTLLINHTLPYTVRADENGNPLRIPPGYPGAGQEAAYGYLTPAEAEWLRAHRTPAKARGYREAAE